MITLAFSVRRMLMDQNFVKKLASCEIMGGANNICSDKTGTLTMNKMTVTNIFIGVDKIIKIHDPVYKYSDYFTNDRHSQMF
jgi:P-type E1-E2 ATPase